jgi:dihydropteroate synthase
MRPAQGAKRDAFLRQIGMRPLLMGIVNVTPDSFSDGGQFFNTSAALERAKRLAAEGADIIDVGGESTRPGATPLPVEEELTRIEPVLAALEGALEVSISIDTYKARVAARAVDLGAILINDVWGLQKDTAMAGVVAETGAAVVIMHNRADKDPSIDIMADIRRFFDRSLKLAADAGILSGRIMLDPGIGFAKTSQQNIDAIRRLSEIRDYGLPILIGVSRKAFLGSTSDGSEASLVGTIAVGLAAAANGASLFRVHDIAPHAIAFRAFQAVREIRSP